MYNFILPLHDSLYRENMPITIRVHVNYVYIKVSEGRADRWQNINQFAWAYNSSTDMRLTYEAIRDFDLTAYFGMR